MESDERLQAAQDALIEFGRAAQVALNAIVDALRPLMDAVAEAARTVYVWMRERYHEASAPYGDTDDGMLRWLRELLDVERLRREAQVILDRQQFLAELRAQRF